MIRYTIAYIVAAVVFLAMDAVYLRFVGAAMYRQVLGDQLLEQFRALPAILFYLLYLGGLVYFAVAPAFDTGRWSTALGRGAILGFIAYATYDLTNYATLVRWHAKLAVVDLIWGSVVSAVAAAVAAASAMALVALMAR